jgi:hypothetical protein
MASTSCNQSHKISWKNKIKPPLDAWTVKQFTTNNLWDVAGTTKHSTIIQMEIFNCLVPDTFFGDFLLSMKDSTLNIPEIFAGATPGDHFCSTPVGNNKEWYAYTLNSNAFACLTDPINNFCTGNNMSFNGIGLNWCPKKDKKGVQTTDQSINIHLKFKYGNDDVTYNTKSLPKNEFALNIHVVKGGTQTAYTTAHLGADVLKYFDDFTKVVLLGNNKTIFDSFFNFSGFRLNTVHKKWIRSCTMCRDTNGKLIWRSKVKLPVSILLFRPFSFCCT